MAQILDTPGTKREYLTKNISKDFSLTCRITLKDEIEICPRCTWDSCWCYICDLHYVKLFSIDCSSICMKTPKNSINTCHHVHKVHLGQLTICYIWDQRSRKRSPNKTFRNMSLRLLDKLLQMTSTGEPGHHGAPVTNSFVIFVISERENPQKNFFDRFLFEL